MPADEARRIVFHIGPPKTGSTYLQELLWANREVLRSNGVFLPGSRQRSHHHVARDIRGQQHSPTQPQDDWAGAFEAMMLEIERADAPTSVISSELLARTPTDRIRRVFDRCEGFEVHVVYGIRDLARQVTSVWQQGVRHSNPRRLHDWLTEVRARSDEVGFWGTHDAITVLSRWAPSDPSRMHVFTMPESGGDTEFVDRFRRAIGWECEIDTDLERTNESLGFLEATLLSQIQEKIPPMHWGRREEITRAFIARRVLAGRPDPLPILIPEEFRGWLEEQSAARIEFLRQSDFEIIGSLDDLRLDESRFGDVSEAGHEAEMLDAATDVIGQLVERQANLAIRVDRLSRELDSAQRGRAVLRSRVVARARRALSDGLSRTAAQQRRRARDEAGDGPEPDVV